VESKTVLLNISCTVGGDKLSVFLCDKTKSWPIVMSVTVCTGDLRNKKLSCRREAARCFASSNTLLSR